MTESFYVEVLKQVPALGVLAWIVWKFLAHLESQQAGQNAAEAQREMALRDMSGKTEAAMMKVATSMERNAEVLARNTGTLDRMDRVLEALEALVAKK